MAVNIEITLEGRQTNALASMRKYFDFSDGVFSVSAPLATFCSPVTEHVPLQS